ncbi:hypothetical protein CYMTET_52968 [Cymbomonas tetramitiformis]|uniref:Uncharacterized protein n=1 Tax=Cymbomonas tetramitiformis TaxID=36881 RepID=A0AAE0BJS2_9CHLO|nr:hypothetical protein CYMTET_52968 [Cymbomonas tetramitiformis]
MELAGVPGYFQNMLSGLAPNSPQIDSGWKTPLPIVHSCIDSEVSQDTLDDFSRWVPDGDWPTPKPLHRVALFAGVYNHVVDGVALTCNRLVAYLTSQGHHVQVFAPTLDPPRLKHAGNLFPIPSVAAPGRPEYRIALGLTGSAKEALAAFKPDLVHIATPDVLGFQAQSWARENGIPVVCAYHTHFAQYLTYYRLGALEGAMWSIMHRFYSGCVHTYVPTTTVAQELQDHGVQDSDGIRLWTRGVDTKMFSPTKRCPEWREALGIDDGQPVILIVCRLVWEKALDIYTHVVNTLRINGIDHKAVIVGDGPAALGMKDMVPEAIFLGSLSGPELARAYASSDIFLFPSNTETFGITTLEAMASGLPVVVADKNFTQLVSHGVNGLLAPIGDRATFAEMTQELVLDKSLREKLGAAGRRRAEDYWQWGRSFTELVGHYNEAIAMSSRR